MKITNVNIRKVADQVKMKAIVSITFDNLFAVHDIKVIQGQERLFIAMPSRKTPDGQYFDITHPINAEFRSELENTILQAYEQLLQQDEDRFSYIPE